jgi:4-hydroxybenzoate polyprenyltransferase
MIRFSHTLFALPFALLAAVMAWAAPGGAFTWRALLGILVCMATARSAAMAFNRIVDRKIDAVNPRTKVRHLPTGTLSLGAVVFFTILCSLGFIAGTLLFLPENFWPLYASVPVLLFLLGYSYAKRFTMLAHFWLGTALGLSPLGAWVAIRGELAAAPAMLGAAVLFWVGGFDLIYACQDTEFDKKMNLKSVPARIGVAGSLRLAAVCHFVTLVCLALLPTFYPAFGLIYYSGVAAIAILLIYEHSVVRPDDLSRVNLAFFHVNVIISLGLLAIGSADLLWRYFTN